MIPLKDNLPTGRFPIVTVLLIAANILVFGWMLTWSEDPDSSTSPAVPGLSQYDEGLIELGAIPYRILNPGSECGVVTATPQASSQVSDSVVCSGSEAERQAETTPGVAVVPVGGPPWWVTILTSMFLHGGIFHLVGNMLFLWVFGNNVEDSMGRGRFLAFYLLAGTAAVYSQALLDTTATAPTIGASGAVAGVLGAYILLHPQARVLTLVILIFFVTLIEVPAAVLLAIWFILQFIPAVGQVAASELGSGGVAYFAHVGGFVFGLLAVKLFARRARAPAELATGG